MVIRVIYQRSTLPNTRSAFTYIDDGYVNAWRAAGAAVEEWHDGHSRPLREVLHTFRPTHFLANLQKANREPASWTQPEDLDALVRYRDQNPLFVACRSGPSDMPDFASTLGLDFERYPERGVQSFYTQPRRPVQSEREAIDAGVIDLIRSPLASECYPVCFRSFLDLGLAILEELHAADVHRYQPIGRPKDIDVSFVGGCWPFKWANMRPYVEALRYRFGSRFQIWGHGWPEGVSEGVLGEGPSESDESLVDVVARSKVSIALHEPSQVTSTPFATNERPFKLLALGACVVCDPNPMLMSRFRDGESMCFAASPERMADLVGDLLDDEIKRRRIGTQGQHAVRQVHTYDARVSTILDLAGRPLEAGVIYRDSPADAAPTHHGDLTHAD